MEKIKIVLLLWLFTIPFAKGQDTPIVRKGLLKTQLTLSPAYKFTNNESCFYLHGNLEGFLENNISLSGDAYLSMGSLGSKQSVFDFNHNDFFGVLYHFIKNNNDLYLGIQPGVSISQLNTTENNLHITDMGVNPVISAVLGYNFFANEYFHFFIQSRYVAGQHLYDAPINLSEIRFSAGLGFNINTLKAK